MEEEEVRETHEEGFRTTAHLLPIMGKPIVRQSVLDTIDNLLSPNLNAGQCPSVEQLQELAWYAYQAYSYFGGLKHEDIIRPSA